jgi:hypothetical protein
VRRPSCTRRARTRLASDTVEPLGTALRDGLRNSSSRRAAPPRPIHDRERPLVAPPTLRIGESVEERKIYDTHLFGKSNQGHTFTSVLSDDERKDLIEFLKTI